MLDLAVRTGRETSNHGLFFAFSAGTAVADGADMLRPRHLSSSALLSLLVFAGCSVTPTDDGDSVSTEEDLSISRGWNTGWTVVPGRAIGDATIASAAAGRKSLFVRGLNDRLYRWEWDASANAFGPYQELPSTLPLSSSPVAVAFAGRLEIFARGGKGDVGSLLHWSCPRDAWRACDYEVVGGGTWFHGKPAVVATRSGVDVFVAGGEGTMFHRPYFGSGVRGSPLGTWTALGVTFSGWGSAASYVDGSGRENVVVVAGNSSGGTVHELRFVDGARSAGWTLLPGAGLLNDAPTIVSHAGTLRVFGRGLDDAIWSLTHGAKGWSTRWQRQAACTRGAMAVMADGNRMDMVIMAKDGRILHNRWDLYPTNTGAAATCCGPSYGTCCLEDPSPSCMPYDAADPRDFGYEKYVARGARPLLVVALNDKTKPAYTRTIADIRAHAFGSAGFSGTAPAPSVAAYFSEMSNGAFTFRDAGVFGPFDANFSTFGTEDAVYQANLRKVALDRVAATGFDFAAFDTDGDRRITPSELTLMVVANDSSDGGATRWIGDHCLNDTSGRRFCFPGSAASSGHQADVNLWAHELTHVLEPDPDLYGWGVDNECVAEKQAVIDPVVWAGRPACKTAEGKDGRSLRAFPTNTAHSLMAGSPNGRLLHLDPFTKMRLGWVKPRVRNMRVYGSAMLQVPQLATSAERSNEDPVLLFDPERGTREFFLLDHRNRYQGPAMHYDSGALSSTEIGLSLWHVRLQDNGDVIVIPGETIPERWIYSVHTRSAPDFGQAGSRPWTDADGAFRLRFQDLTNAPAELRVGTPVNLGNWLPVTWTPRP